MQLLVPSNHDNQLHLNYCICSACLHKPKLHLQVKFSDVGTPNCMNEFVKALPSQFPLWIQQTVLLNRREDSSLEYQSYFNLSKDDCKKSSVSIFRQQIRGLNNMTCQNVQIYFKNKQRIMARFQVIDLISKSKGEKMSALDGDIIYIQPYQPRPIIRVEYLSINDKAQLDSILTQYIQKQEQLYKAQTFKVNQQFLQFVYQQYSEDIFFQFLTVFFAKLYKLTTGSQIKRAVMLWTIEPHKNDFAENQTSSKARDLYNKMMQIGRPKKLNFKPKLVNIKELQITHFQKYYSFQEEYNSLIKNKIAATEKKTISAIKNKAYRNRLQNFRNKIHSTYEKEQEDIMKNVQEEKQFQFQHQTEKMAKMLIPNMGQYKTLREILNDQTAFRKVIMKRKNSIRVHTETSSIVNPRIKNFTISSKKHSTQQTAQKKHYISSSPTTNVHNRYYKLLTPSTHS